MCSGWGTITNVKRPAHQSGLAVSKIGSKNSNESSVLVPTYNNLNLSVQVQKQISSVHIDVHNSSHINLLLLCN